MSFVTAEDRRWLMPLLKPSTLFPLNSLFAPVHHRALWNVSWLNIWPSLIVFYSVILQTSKSTSNFVATKPVNRSWNSCDVLFQNFIRIGSVTHLWNPFGLRRISSPKVITHLSNVSVFFPCLQSEGLNDFIQGQLTIICTTTLRLKELSISCVACIAKCFNGLQTPSFSNLFCLSVVYQSITCRFRNVDLCVI